jgi:arginase
MRNIKIIEVKSEIGAGTRGASLGIDAIRIAALDFMSNLFVNFPSETVETENRLLYEPVASPYAKRIQGILTMYERVSNVVYETVKSGLFPIVLTTVQPEPPLPDSAWRAPSAAWEWCG